MASASANIEVRIIRADDFGFYVETRTATGKLLSTDHIEPGSWSKPVTFLSKAFGEKVKAFRGAYSLRQAAERARVHAATLSRIERGHTPDIHTFFQLCHWMMVDPSQFVLVESEPEDG